MIGKAAASARLAPDVFFQKGHPMEQNQNLDFIKEKVKERPINRKKLMRRTILTASMAVIFGLIACLTFLVLEPVFSNLLYPEEEPEQVQLREESAVEEMKPEDMILEEEEETVEVEVPQTVVEKVELEMTDYQRLYRVMYAKAQEVSNSSLVTVTSVTSDVDWFNNIYENNGQSAGLIVADSGRELLILADSSKAASADRLIVTFSDDTQADAQIKGTDEETGLTIISVPSESISEQTKNRLESAVLGSAGSSLLAAPVIAIGRPLGSAESVIYGMVTSVETYVNLEDYNVRILTTDISSSNNSSGVLINFSGQVVGVLRPGKAESGMNVLTAYSVSDLRTLVEKLMNGQTVAHIGVLGTDVPREIHEELGVPLGAYVKEIVMDSPAMNAGVQSGDVIVKIGTAEIASFAEYQQVLQNLLPDTSTTITVMRQGPEEYEEMTLDIIIGR